MFRFDIIGLAQVTLVFRFDNPAGKLDLLERAHVNLDTRIARI